MDPVNITSKYVRTHYGVPASLPLSLPTVGKTDTHALVSVKCTKDRDYDKVPRLPCSLTLLINLRSQAVVHARVGMAKLGSKTSIDDDDGVAYEKTALPNGSEVDHIVDHIVATKKENGKFFSFTFVNLDGVCILFGSKHKAHLLPIETLLSDLDVEATLKSDALCVTILEHLRRLWGALSEEARSSLVTDAVEHGYTYCGELCDGMHMVPVDEPHLAFFAVTKMEKSVLHQLSYLDTLGLPTVERTTIPVTKIIAEATAPLRSGVTEGYVLYYQSKDDETLAIEKFKTHHYVMLRILREMLKLKNMDPTDVSRFAHKLAQRKDLRLSQGEKQSWFDKFVAFAKWLHASNPTWEHRSKTIRDVGMGNLWYAFVKAVPDIPTTPWPEKKMGKCFVILGPQGSGKTTVAKLLAPLVGGTLLEQDTLGKKFESTLASIVASGGVAVVTRILFFRSLDKIKSACSGRASVQYFYPAELETNLVELAFVCAQGVLGRPDHPLSAKSVKNRVKITVNVARHMQGRLSWLKRVATAVPFLADTTSLSPFLDDTAAYLEGGEKAEIPESLCVKHDVAARRPAADIARDIVATLDFSASEKSDEENKGSDGESEEVVYAGVKLPSGLKKKLPKLAASIIGKPEGSWRYSCSHVTLHHRAEGEVPASLLSMVGESMSFDGPLVLLTNGSVIAFAVSPPSSSIVDKDRPYHVTVCVKKGHQNVEAKDLTRLFRSSVADVSDVECKSVDGVEVSAERAVPEHGIRYWVIRNGPVVKGTIAKWVQGDGRLVVKTTH